MSENWSYLMEIEQAKREVWNEAIEAAAKMIEDKFDFLGEELIAATEIRKLKR